MSTNYIDQITDTAGTTHDISEGDSTRIFRATCTTAAGTTAKVATLDTSNRNFSLTTGVRVAVTFKYGNSATTPTLRVDGSSTGTAKTIASATAVATRTTGNGTTYNTWGPYETVIFTYDGTYWVQSGSSLSIYNAYTLAESKTASTTTPKMDGTAAVGSETAFARGDHRHPTDTSRVPTTRTVNGKALSSDISLTASDVGALSSSGDLIEALVVDGGYSDKLPLLHVHKGDHFEFLEGTGISITPSSTDEGESYTHQLQIAGVVATTSSNGLMPSTHFSAVNGATDTPTASKISKFDSSAHINSEDMSASDVTDFVDSLSGTSIAPIDYVVEEGTHNLWKYVKWNSGRIELWGKFEQTVTSYTTNAWVIGHASLTNYPSGITNPIAVATCQKIGTGGGTINYDYERTDYWSGIANNFNGTIAQGESRTISWYVYVNARWK